MALEPHGRLPEDLPWPDPLAAPPRPQPARRPPDRRCAARLTAVLLGLIVIGWGAGELSQALHGGDLHVVRDLATQRTPELTAVARVLSQLGSSLLIIPLAGVCCVILLRRRGRAAALYIALATAGAVAIFNVDKLLVGRPRPPVEHLEAATHFSFPSGHATLAAAFYLTLLGLSASLRSSRVRRAATSVVAVSLVVGIAVSRVYLGVHYPTDVAAGVLLGSAWTLAVTAELVRHLDRAQAARGSSP